MRLTEHFELIEFVRSSTADKLGIKNEPSNEAVENLRVLCKQILEPLRRFANEPLHINSGFRCSALNMAVGGVSNSNHLYGFAADVSCSDWQKCLNWQAYLALMHDFDECICERHGNSILASCFVQKQYATEIQGILHRQRRFVKETLFYVRKQQSNKATL